MIQCRIEYLAKYYNLLKKTKGTNHVKQEIRMVRHELLGYGVLMLRRKDGVIVDLPDGTEGIFKVEGALETALGNIIGYNCCDCGQVASIKNWKDHFRIEVNDYDILACKTCGGFVVEPIYDDFIRGR